MALSFPMSDIAIVVAVSLLICATVCTLAMEAAVIFTPAFLFLFPAITSQFPPLTPNGAIGLSMVIEFFGYTSSVLGYWYRGQIRWPIVGAAIILTIPMALVLRFFSYLIKPVGLLAVFGILLLLLGGFLYGTRRRIIHGEGVFPNNRSFASLDRTAFAMAGALAGLVGIGVGEIVNTLFLTRKRLPVRLSVGTSAAILHLTIFSAMLFNVLLLQWQPAGLHTEAIVIPWGLAVIIAPTVIVGGQIGAFLNSWLPQGVIVKTLVSMYVLIGLGVLGQVLWG